MGKYCKKCGILLSLNNTYSNDRQIYYYICRKCKNKQDYLYCKTPEGRRKRILAHIKRTKKYKEVVHSLLGNKCANPQCPILQEKMDPRCLQVDHVNGQGTQELRRKNSECYYKDLIKRIKEGSKDYQLLCVYCNWLKRYQNREVKDYELP